MSTIYRRLFFWIFVVLFIVTTPLAILYSQGYRFDNYKKIFIHSGSITVKSTPSSVNIFLNGKRASSSSLDMINNSTTINGLRPGVYDVRVAADGYADWEKTVEVHSGVSTEFWNVFLAPKDSAPTEIDSLGAERYFSSPFGKKIAYYKKNNDQLEVWSVDVKNNLPSLIFSRAGFDFSNNLLENAEWDSKENLLIIPVLSDGRKDFFILDSQKKQEPIQLSQLVDLDNLNDVRWSPSNQNEIYFIATPKNGSQDNLYRFSLDTKEPEVILENIKAYDLSKNSIYYLRQNDILYKSDLDGKNESQTILSALNFAGSSDHPRIIAYDDARQVVISEGGEVYVHNKGDNSESINKIGENIKSVQFSDDGKKLLFWSENEIDVLFLRDWDVQPKRVENEIQQVVRYSSPIKNVFWYRDYEHIFFSVQGAVKIVELDSRDHRALFDIMKYNSDDFLSSYDSANGIFYYRDETDGNKKIFYFNIPQQKGFFGG